MSGQAQTGQKGAAAKLLNIAIYVVGIAMCVYHLAYTQLLLVGAVEHINIHYAFAFTLVLLVAAKKNPGLRWLYLLSILLVLAGTGYVWYFVDDLSYRAGRPTIPDMIVGTGLVILVLAICWQSFGSVLPIVALVFIAYFLFGQYIPGFLYHFKFPYSAVISRIAIGLDGMYGVSGAVSANYIFLFILFGSLLQVSGATGFFMEAGKAVGRRLRGGPAQVAVVSSLMVGTVTGSAMANVAITGAYTIPLMKKVGYRPEQAGAIEAAASSGGQIMPPVMGAAAFMMVGITGIPYILICAAALIPALLYFLSVGLYCELQARRHAVAPMTEKVDTRLMLANAYLFVIPLGGLIYLLIIGMSPMTAVFWAIVAMVVLSFMRKGTRPSPEKLAAALVDGAVGGARIAAACAVVGLVLATVSGAGLGLKLSSAVVTWSAGNLVLLALLAMIASLILGMGVPTVGAYVLVATLVAPAMMKAGVPLLQAHLFAFYYAVFSTLTPPVALSAMVGASIAGASYVKTSVEACKIATPAYIIGFLFIWNPTLVGKPPSFMVAVLTLVAVSVGLAAIVMTVTSQYVTRLTRPEVALAALSAVALIAYGFVQVSLLFVIGMAVFVALTVWQVRRRRILAAVSQGPARKAAT